MAVVVNPAFVAPAPAVGEILSHQWIFDGMRIQLYRKVDELACVVIDHLGNVLSRNSLSLTGSGYSIDQLIEVLVTHSYPIFKDGEVHFTHTSLVYERPLPDGRKLILSEHKNKLIWQLFDAATHTTSSSYPRVSLYNGYPPNSPMWKRYERLSTSNFLEHFGLSSRLVPVSANTFDLIKRQDRMKNTRIYHFIEPSISIEDQEREGYGSCSIHEAITAKFLDDYRHMQPPNFQHFLDNFSLTEIRTRGDLLESLIFTPTFLAASKLHDSRIVDQDTWVITLTDTDPGFRGHAQLVIETMEITGYHMYIADLRSKETGRVRLKKLLPDNLQYAAKENSWALPRESVENMLDAIQEQIDLQEAGRTAVCFNLLGEGGIFVGQTKQTADGILPVHNCITWARWALRQAGIDIGTTINPLFTSPKQYKDIQSKQMARRRAKVDAETAKLMSKIKATTAV